MIVLSETIKDSRSKNNHQEIKLKARAVSRGVAVGKIVCLHGRRRQFYKVQLKNTQIKRELRRFNAAIRLAKRQLKKYYLQNTQNVGSNQTNIFETHLMILEDRSLHQKIEENIKNQKVNAEWAVKIVIDNYIAQYKTMTDEHLREKYIDLEDIAERILTALGGGKKTLIKLKKNSIIVAKEVRPSTLIELIESNPKAIITEDGGWTSHTFILARELNLPAVTGLKGILRRVETGEKAIVDGYSGQVFINPTDKTLSNYESVANQTQPEKIETSGGKLKTLDGQEITIRVNVDLPKAYSKAKKFGAQGIGLYRSEFLFNQFKGFPSENEQIAAYRNIADLVGDEGAKIRTFDLSLDLLADKTESQEQNPALGLRAIRLSLNRQKEFRIQLRALLQAATDRKIDIILPMICDISEIRQTKKLIEIEKEYLRKRKIGFGNPRIGAMIEVPASVFVIDEIAKETEFLCLGTNDLVQYLLAVDRDNEMVADWFQTLHPAVIRAIKKVLQAGNDNDIPVIVCGEMAGSEFYVPILIGLGVKELSMNINSIPKVKKVVSGIAFEETIELNKEIENCKTALEVESVVRKSFEEKWAHLISNELKPSRKK